MSESQNIEYKQSWHDNNLKWIYMRKADGFISVKIADACFKGGLIDAWGRGTVKIIETCIEAGLPEPEFIERDGGFLVTLFKNNLTGEQLKKLGLNERQVDAILFYRAKGEIKSSEYAERYKIAERTARVDLSELVEKKLLYKQGETKSVKYFFNAE